MTCGRTGNEGKGVSHFRMLITSYLIHLHNRALVPPSNYLVYLKSAAQASTFPVHPSRFTEFYLIAAKPRGRPLVVLRPLHLPVYPALDQSSFLPSFLQSFSAQILVRSTKLGSSIDFSRWDFTRFSILHSLLCLLPEMNNTW